jgi:uncharacterized HAD superfamily protein
MNVPYIIAVDVDGTLTEDVCWTEDECRNARISAVGLEVAAKVREAYKTNWIVINTARRDHLIPVTMQWLRLHDIPFHSISNHKIPANFYIDDRAINPTGVLCLPE